MSRAAHSQPRPEGRASLAETFLDALDEAALRELAGRLGPYLGHGSDRLLNVREKAEQLGIHPDTVVRMAREGRLSALKVGREWRFRADDLEIAVLRAGPTSSTPTHPRHISVQARASVAAIRGKRCG